MQALCCKGTNRVLYLKQPKKKNMSLRNGNMMAITRFINNFFAFYDEEKLVGFINWRDEGTAVFFGIGVNPACCNQGYGQQITKTACKISNKLFPGKPLYLEVRTWNTRAVRCYEKAGFHIAGEPIKQTTSIGEGVFYHMVTE